MEGKKEREGAGGREGEGTEERGESLKLVTQSHLQELPQHPKPAQPDEGQSSLTGAWGGHFTLRTQYQLLTLGLKRRMLRVVAGLVHPWALPGQPPENCGCQ